jgi:hypothetical protein
VPRSGLLLQSFRPERGEERLRHREAEPWFGLGRDRSLFNPPSTGKRPASCKVSLLSIEQVLEGLHDVDTQIDE